MVALDQIANSLRLYPIAAKFTRRNLWVAAAYHGYRWTGVYHEFCLN